MASSIFVWPGLFNGTQWLLPEGSAAAPSLTFAAFSTAGLFDVSGTPHMSVGGLDTYVFGASLFQTNTAILAGTSVTGTSLIASAGGVTVASTTLVTTSVSLTDVTGASAGTITNAPAVGNPTKWISIVDNGTTRKIPTWT